MKFCTTFKVGEEEYQARLTARACVELEKTLGENPLNVFTSLTGNELPSLNTLLTILKYSLTGLNHSLTMNDVYNLYDKYCDNGGNIASLIEFILDVLKVSGFIPQEPTNEKN